MTGKHLDITGNVSPYCLLVVEKEARRLGPSGELIITCDNPAAATSQIPRIAVDLDLVLESKKVAPGRFEIRLSKK